MSARRRSGPSSTACAMPCSPRFVRRFTTCHICTGTGLAPATSVPGLGSPLPTSASGLGSPLPHLHRDWAHPCHVRTGTGLAPSRICIGTGLTPATSAPGLGSPPLATFALGLGSPPLAASAPGLGPPWPHLEHLHRNWAHPCHICTGNGTGPTPATSAPGLGSSSSPRFARGFAVLSRATHAPRSVTVHAQCALRHRLRRHVGVWG